MAIIHPAEFKKEVLMVDEVMTLDEQIKGLEAHTSAVPVFGINENLQVTIWSQMMEEVTGWCSAETLVSAFAAFTTHELQYVVACVRATILSKRLSREQIRRTAKT
jgi:hypothetical protein